MSREVTGFHYTPTNTLLVERGFVKVEYTNSNSEKSTFKIHEDNIKLKIFKLIDKYATTDNPNITGKEVVEIRKEFSMFAQPIIGGTHFGLDYYKGMDFLLDTYVSEDSDAGKEISPKEIAYMYEAIQNWGG